MTLLDALCVYQNKLPRNDLNNEMTYEYLIERRAA